MPARYSHLCQWIENLTRSSCHTPGKCHVTGPTPGECRECTLQKSRSCSPQCIAGLGAPRPSLPGWTLHRRCREWCSSPIGSSGPRWKLNACHWGHVSLPHQMEAIYAWTERLKNSKEKGEISAIIIQLFSELIKICTNWLIKHLIHNIWFYSIQQQIRMRSAIFKKKIRESNRHKKLKS